MNWIKLSRTFINLAAIARLEWSPGENHGRIIWLSGDTPMLIREPEAIALVEAIESSGCHDGSLTIVDVEDVSGIVKNLEQASPPDILDSFLI